MSQRAVRHLPNIGLVSNERQRMGRDFASPTPRQRTNNLIRADVVICSRRSEDPTGCAGGREDVSMEGNYEMCLNYHNR